MWYVVPHGATLNMETNQPFDNYNEAKEKAEVLHQSFGNHYHVIRVTVAYTTKTLAEAMAE